MWLCLCPSIQLMPGLVHCPFKQLPSCVLFCFGREWVEVESIGMDYLQCCFVVLQNNSLMRFMQKLALKLLISLKECSTSGAFPLLMSLQPLIGGLVKLCEKKSCLKAYTVKSMVSSLQFMYSMESVIRVTDLMFIDTWYST